MNESEIKNRAHELCEKNLAHLGDVKERNDQIVNTLMREFNISREQATECFINNNRS